LRKDIHKNNENHCATEELKLFRDTAEVRMNGAREPADRGQLYRDSNDEFTSQVKSIEQRADECLKRLHLLNAPPHIAYWTILSATVHIIEENYERLDPIPLRSMLR
jgi:hypothetical protein